MGDGLVRELEGAGMEFPLKGRNIGRDGMGEGGWDSSGSLVEGKDQDWIGAGMEFSLKRRNIGKYGTGGGRRGG